MMIPLFYDKSMLQSGIKLPVNWTYTKAPHMLVFGSTGSGKTYAVKLILGRIRLHILGAQVTVCDYKADDFKFLEGCSRYYSYNSCGEGLDSFYKAFQARQQGEDSSRTFRLLLFDEWAAYLNSLDKKQSEIEKQKLTTLLMLGRSFNVHIIVSQQRADAQYFNTARDNFSVVVALGNLSNESKQMFFSEYKEQIKPVSRIGAGYMLTNGTNLTEIQVPQIRNHKKLESAIRKIVI